MVCLYQLGLSLVLSTESFLEKSIITFPRRPFTRLWPVIMKAAIDLLHLPVMSLFHIWIHHADVLRRGFRYLRVAVSPPILCFEVSKRLVFKHKKPLQIALKCFQQCVFLCGVFFVRFNAPMMNNKHPKKRYSENKIYIYSHIEFCPIYYIQFVASSCFFRRGAESVYSTPSLSSPHCGVRYVYPSPIKAWSADLAWNWTPFRGTGPPKWPFSLIFQMGKYLELYLNTFYLLQWDCLCWDSPFGASLSKGASSAMTIPCNILTRSLLCAAGCYI